MMIFMFDFKVSNLCRLGAIIIETINPIEPQITELRIPYVQAYELENVSFYGEALLSKWALFDKISSSSLPKTI